MLAGKVWHSELHQKGKVENESLGAPWTGERNVLNQWWDFLSIHSSSVAQDRRVGEKKTPNPHKTRSAVWISSSSASSGSVRTWQMFSLASFLKTSRFSPWKLFALFATTSRWRGTRGCSKGSARWGPGLCLGPPRVPPWVGRARVSPPAPWALTQSWGGHLLSHSPALGSTWLAPEVSQPAPSRPRPVGAGRSKEITAGARGDMATGHHLT